MASDYLGAYPVRTPTSIAFDKLVTTTNIKHITASTINGAFSRPLHLRNSNS